MALNIQHLESGISVVVLEGRLDSAQAKEFIGLVNAAADQNRVKLILDMAQVDFVDSSGLGSLVVAHKQVNNRGGDIKIISLRPEVRTIFELTRLHRIFDIFETLDIARNQFLCDP